MVPWLDWKAPVVCPVGRRFQSFWPGGRVHVSESRDTDTFSVALFQGTNGGPLPGAAAFRQLCRGPAAVPPLRGRPGELTGGPGAVACSLRVGGAGLAPATAAGREPLCLFVILAGRGSSRSFRVTVPGRRAWPWAAFSNPNRSPGDCGVWTFDEASRALALVGPRYCSRLAGAQVDAGHSSCPQGATMGVPTSHWAPGCPPRDFLSGWVRLSTGRTCRSVTGVELPALQAGPTMARRPLGGPRTEWWWDRT